MDAIDKVSFHAEALVMSFAESIGDSATGVWNLWTETAPERASKSYDATRTTVDKYLPGMGPIAGGISAATSLVLGVTLIPAGESIGGGMGMAVYGRNAEEVALGVASTIGGVGATCAIFVGTFSPKPVITISSAHSYEFSGLGEMALAPVASIELAGVSAIAGAAGGSIISGGIYAMSAETPGTGWDKLFDKYGAEFMRDRPKSATLNLRISPAEMESLKALAGEARLTVTDVVRLAIKLLRDSIE